MLLIPSSIPPSLFPLIKIIFSTFRSVLFFSFISKSVIVSSVKSCGVRRKVNITSIANMEKMDVDDVVDLSMSIGRDSVSLSTATVRDLRALTQNAGLTITPAPPSTVNNGMFVFWHSSFAIPINRINKRLCVFVVVNINYFSRTI